MDIASSRRIKLNELFLFRICFHRMSAASVLIQLIHDNLLQPSGAMDIASNRRIKLNGLFLLWTYFHRMSAAPVLIQL
jgi:hypothetical protein